MDARWQEDAVGDLARRLEGTPFPRTLELAVMLQWLRSNGHGRDDQDTLREAFMAWETELQTASDQAPREPKALPRKAGAGHKRPGA